MSRYTSATDADHAEMLEAIGVSSVDELFADVPEDLRLGRPLDLPDGLDEAEVYERMRELASRNADTESEVCFLGAGMYDHYVPAIVDAITSRSRVPDALHAVPARDLPGRPAGHVRVPDRDVGADRPAALERRPLRGPLDRRRRRLPGDRRDQAPSLRRLARASIPQSRETLATYAKGYPAEIAEVELSGGLTDPARSLRSSTIRPPPSSSATPTTSARVEDLEALAKVAHDAGALLVASCDPIALGILRPPGRVRRRRRRRRGPAARQPP